MGMGHAQHVPKGICAVAGFNEGKDTGALFTSTMMLACIQCPSRCMPQQVHARTRATNAL